MKPKAKIKIIIDTLMTLALLFLMGYQFWGDALHEWAGAIMFALFIAHHLLNLGWYKNLFRGKLTPFKLFQVLVDFAVFAAMLMLMYSGIAMSRHIFAFLPIDGGMALARRLHILGSHWGFALMSLHLGMHWAMFVGMAKKSAKLQKPSRLRAAIAFLSGTCVAGYGAYAFIKRDFLTYMLLKSEFVFMDFSESKFLFYLDYLALMGLFVFIGHYASKLLKEIKRKKVMR